MNSEREKSCCTPATGRGSDSKRAGERNSVSKFATEKGTSSGIDIPVVQIPGGNALTGTDNPMILMDGEAPCRYKQLDSFRMMQTVVTNELFDSFVSATGYVTEAERFGWSFVFHNYIVDSIDITQGVAGSPWWRKVDGANWRLVNGPGSENDCLKDHPVVHVSWNDAIAFAKWVGGRLPSESEWEHAARGGLGDVPFPWGTREPNDIDFQPCNIWQGSFPDQNSCADGYPATAPAKSFGPNGYGLNNMCGNVWEWTSGRFKIQSRSKEARRHAKNMRGTKVLKGGSYLCHLSYCFRYRIAARTGTTPDSTTAHQGFRLVF